VRLATVPDVDWLARVREGFHGFDLGPFRIQPAWETAAPADPARLVLVVEPGQAFGTGSHETTRLCLLALHEAAARRELGSVVDLGAGSAILAIAALKLGAASATAVEIDPEAIDGARRHASLNRVPVRIVQCDGGRALRPGRFDVVVANLSAPLLRERRDEILRLLRPGGSLVLAGFLRDDLAEILEAYRGAGEVTQRADGEWAALIVSALLAPP
jgi:ribosomal protein L11 methyltransferase